MRSCWPFWLLPAGVILAGCAAPGTSGNRAAPSVSPAVRPSAGGPAATSQPVTARDIEHLEQRVVQVLETHQATLTETVTSTIQTTNHALDAERGANQRMLMRLVFKGGIAAALAALGIMIILFCSTPPVDGAGRQIGKLIGLGACVGGPLVAMLLPF